MQIDLKTPILVIVGLILVALVACMFLKEKPKQENDDLIQDVEDNGESQEFSNFSGLVDGASSIASSAMLLGIVIVGVVLVIGMVVIKKAADNPDRAFEIINKGADLRNKLK